MVLGRYRVIAFAMITHSALVFVLAFLQCLSGLASDNPEAGRTKRQILVRTDNGIKIILPAVNHRLVGNAKTSRKTTKKQDVKDPVVDITEGSIRGLTEEWKGTKLHKFLGVPYAGKPERFKMAKPMKHWSGVRDATKGEVMCMQRHQYTRIWDGSEDCLFLDIITPTLEDKKLPVLVWIHGGMFKYGDGRLTAFGPQKLNQKGLVVVGINYRLGLFGFLNSGTADAPGNMGLKDCVMALRWIKKNIQNFGGDPNSITTYGISTGAMVVECLVLSPMTKDLMHKSIMQSGSMLSSWSTSKDPIRHVYHLGKLLNETSTDVDVIMKRLIEADKMDLLKLGEKIATDAKIFVDIMPFVPSAEKIIPGEEPFFTDYPVNILKSGQFEGVPMMMGFNDIEGLFFTKNDFNIDELLKPYNQLFEEFVPPQLIDAVESVQKKNEIVQSVRKLYFGDKPIDNSTVLNVVNLVGDLVFACGEYSSVKIWQRVMKKPVYFMQFAHSGKYSTITRTHLKDLEGAGHAEDMEYVFVSPANQFLEMDNETAIVIDRLITSMANFAKYGNPTPSTSNLFPIKWLPITKDKMRYLKITDKLEMLYDPLKERCDFWNELNKQYLKPFYYE